MKTLLAVLAIALVCGVVAIPAVNACGGMTTISPPPFQPDPIPPDLGDDDGNYSDDEVIL